MNTNGRFYIVRELETMITLNSPLEILPMIWCRNGEYRIIPCEVIENAVNTLSMYTVSGGKRTQPVPVILWSQGIPISNQAGRALIGE